MFGTRNSLRLCFNKSQICSMWTFDAKRIVGELYLILIMLLDVLLSTILRILISDIELLASDVRAISYVFQHKGLWRFYTSNFVFAGPGSSVRCASTWHSSIVASILGSCNIVS